MKSRPSPPFVYPGSKFTLAPDIIRLFPEHDKYLEPFFGSGIVFFSKDRVTYERVNDLNGDIVNFFKMLRERRDDLLEAIYLTPYARDEPYIAEPDASDLERALRFFIQHTQRFYQSTGFRVESYGTNQPMAKRFANMPRKLIYIAERLRGVTIENLDALEFLRRYTSPDSLAYVDPPYPLDTRANGLYKDEYQDEDHIALLDYLISAPGRFILSTYENPLYDKILLPAGWNKQSIESIRIGNQPQEEILYLNYEPAPAPIQTALFNEEINEQV